jgi:hypothetical protein
VPSFFGLLLGRQSSFSVAIRTFTPPLPAPLCALLPPSDTHSGIPPEPPALKAFPQFVEKWELCRQDIHGRDVGMGLFDSEAAAEAAAEVYTARGHHQVYFVRRAVVKAGARVPTTVIPPCPTLDD